jgi:hypothetical protein
LKPFQECGYDLIDLEALWIDDFGAFVHVNVDHLPEDIISKMSVPEEWKIITFCEFNSPPLADDESSAMAVEDTETYDSAVSKKRPAPNHVAL